MVDNFVESSAGASSGGGYRAVTKVRGRLTEIKPPAPSKFGEGDYGEPKLQIEATLEDAAILAVREGEDAYELKDNTFRVYESYGVTPTDAKKGKVPHQNSTYIRCWVLSAEEIWYARYKAQGGTVKFDDWRRDPQLRKGPRDLIGEFVILEKQARALFKQPVMGPDNKPLVDEAGNKSYKEIIAVDKSGYPNHFCFVEDEAANPAVVADKIRERITGLKVSVALRELLMDNYFNQFPEYAQKAENDPEGLAKELGLRVVEGSYQNK